MIRNVDTSGEMLLGQLERMQARLEKAQREISSGYRAGSAADDPDAVAGILSLRAKIESNAQIRTNLGRAQSEVEAADGVLGRAIQVLDHALRLGVAGAGSLSAERRGMLAIEAAGLEEDLVALSRATSEGRFLFSGDADQSAPYRLNPAFPQGVERLVAASATRRVQHPRGEPFRIGRTAQEIFDARDAGGAPTAANAFAAVHSLRVALESSSDAGIAASIDALRAASAHINAQLGFYASVENRIREALDDAGRLDVELKAALSARQDADLTASILELQQVQMNHSAALSARAAVRRGSLFEYLK